MHKFFLPLSIFLFVALPGPAQQIALIARNDSSSLRGMSVVSDQIIWVSGSRGTVGKSTDGGRTWRWITVPHFESRDFRDIEAFDQQEAVILAIAEPAVILKTRDGGNSWYKVYEDSTQGMFLDAMDFVDGRRGIVVGDPVDGKFFLRATEDGGETWHSLPGASPSSSTGEACFASSGTNILLSRNGQYTLVSGGTKSRIISSSAEHLLALQQGRESTGANSLATWQGKKYAITGGDFANDRDSTGNCLISLDGSGTWTKPVVPPHGYRSCVAWLNANQLVCCGTSGVDISNDGGLHWMLLSREGYHVCGKSRTGSAVFFAGSKGRIARLVQEQNKL